MKSITKMGKMYSERLWIWKSHMNDMIDRHGMWRIDVADRMICGMWQILRFCVELEENC